MISIVVTWRDREELGQALPSLLETAGMLGGDLTLVNFGGSREMLSRLVSGNENKLRIVSTGEQTYFNKSCAQNIGAANSSQPVLFFCDCDIIPDPAIIAELVHEIAPQEKTFVTIEKVHETKNIPAGRNHIVSEGYELYLRTADGRELHIHHRSKDLEKGTRMAPGLLLVKRSDFLSINGYNSDFEGWGWESQDIIARLVLGSGLTRIIRGHAMHITHDEWTRVAHARNSDRFENRDKMYREALANYEEGNFSGSYTTDIENFPVERTDGFYNPISI